jgi:hypothetical protein
MSSDEVSMLYNEMLIDGVEPNQASDTLLSLRDAGLL